MNKRYNSVAVLSSVVLICCGALILGQKVNAAGEGKITGTVKLDGTAPHMKGIDMSKDPYCAKAHASDPAHLETVVVGSGGGLENVVLYISDWSGSPTASGRKCVVAIPGCSPSEVNGTDSRAPSAAYRRSQASASDSPAPTAGPLIAASTGTSSVRTDSQVV